MKQHHYLKYQLWLLLFLPTSLMAQNKEEKMPGHITKILKIDAQPLDQRNISYVQLQQHGIVLTSSDSRDIIAVTRPTTL